MKWLGVISGPVEESGKCARQERGKEPQCENDGQQDKEQDSELGKCGCGEMKETLQAHEVSLTRGQGHVNPFSGDMGYRVPASNPLSRRLYTRNPCFYSGRTYN